MRILVVHRRGRKWGLLRCGDWYRGGLLQPLSEEFAGQLAYRKHGSLMLQHVRLVMRNYMIVRSHSTGEY